MYIPRHAHVLVTDGSKSLLFVNHGGLDDPKLGLVSKAEEDNPLAHEIGDDRPGRTAFFGTGRQTAYDEVDTHDAEETRFARETAAALDDMAERHELEHLIVAADPRTLGELRRHYGTRVARLVIAELNKDLVKHPVAAIERIIRDS